MVASISNAIPKGDKPRVAEESPFERLYHDVLRAILLHLPSSYHPMAAAVCREWHKVIRDPSFTAAAEQTYVPKIVLTTRFGPMTKFAGVCNGLLCVQDIYKKVLFLIDPFKREAVPLPQPKGQCYFYLGFDRETLKFKLLALTQNFSRHMSQVLDEGKPSWRSTRTCLPFTHNGRDGVVVGGNCYWISYELYGGGYSRVVVVVSFDFTSEEFVVIPVPGPACWRSDYLMDLSGRLGIAVYIEKEIKVWSLKDDKKSWVLEHTFIPEGYLCSTMSIMNVVGSRQKGTLVVLLRSKDQSPEMFWQDLITFDASTGLIKKRTSVVTLGRRDTMGFFIRESPYSVHSLFPQAGKLLRRIVNVQSSQPTSKMMCEKAGFSVVEI